MFSTAGNGRAMPASDESPVTTGLLPENKDAALDFELPPRSLRHNKQADASNDSRNSCIASFTPKQTPTNRKVPVVTRSTSVKNPYVRKRHTHIAKSNINDNPVTPIPLKLNHIAGTFRGKEISPSSMAKAAKVLYPASETVNKIEQMECQEKRSHNIVIPQTLTYDDGCAETRKHFLRAARKEGKMTLSEFDASHGPMRDDPLHCLHQGVKPVTLKVDSTNSSKLRFDPDSGLPCAFLGQSTPSPRGTLGKTEEVLRSLVEKGCDVKILSPAWVCNHYRWIVWKLACTERRFPDALGGVYLTFNRVLCQLKSRYEKELRDAVRPAIRKVLNRDVASTRLMILVVSQLMLSKRPPSRRGDAPATTAFDSPKARSSHLSAGDEVKLELSDGWYSIPAVLDPILASFVRKGKIEVGTKLLISNAVMLGAEEGIDPLDSSYCSSRRTCPVALKLTANGTRLAKWDAKLGFVPPSPTIQSHEGLLLTRSLSDVIVGGGNIPLVDLVVCRRFPKQFFEKGGAGRCGESTCVGVGKSCVLTEAQEDRCRKEFERRRQRVIEKAAESAERECTEEVDKQAPPEWRKMMTSNSPCDFYEKLDATQKASIDGWKEKRVTLMLDMTRKSIDHIIQDDPTLHRESTPFVRVYVKSFCQKNAFPKVACKGATLTVWRVSEDQYDLLQEGKVVRFKGLAVKPTLHDGLIQLTANSKTSMESLPYQPSTRDLLLCGYQKRSYVSFVRVHLLSRKIASRSFSASSYPEVDVAGILLNVTTECGESSTMKRVYLTDESGLRLRLQREFQQSEHETSPWSKTDVKEQVFAFCDIRILPFDPIENCAVVSWTHTSSQIKRNGCQRLRDLQAWSATTSAVELCGRTSNALLAGLPMNSRLSPNVAIGIGYIVGFLSGIAANSQESSLLAPLRVLVDCGAKGVFVWEFPLFLLDQVLSVCRESQDCTAEDETTTVNLDEEFIDNTLEGIGKRLREVGILFHLLLQRKNSTKKVGETSGCLFEVVQVRRANIDALAYFYLEDAEKRSCAD